MTDALLPETTDARSRLRLNLALYVLSLLAAAALVVAVVTIVSDEIWTDDASNEVPAVPSDAGLSVGPLAEASEEEEQRVASVLDSATGLATAFVNIRHDDLEDTLDAVAEQSTGPFREDIVSAEGSVKRLITQSQAVTEGEVVWAAIESADQDSARVLVATEGTVANKTTKGKPTARYYRLLLGLVNVDGEWLTNSLEFVS